ncbi:MAG: type II toxin-antitoxin system VapC family toxin [Thiobacillus sp.]|nr:type II toxin-antitoxin system VapC family toxin [Thiobacillus sp.]
MRVYLDTSALVKRYLPERNSEAFDAYLAELGPVHISRLTMVELRSTLARKRRQARLNPEQEMAAMNEVRTDIQNGLLSVAPSTDADFIEAFRLMDELTALPLRTLDALHLATASGLGSGVIATADDVMRRAAQQLQLEVAYFGD